MKSLLNVSHETKLPSALNPSSLHGIAHTSVKDEAIARDGAKFLKKVPSFPSKSIKQSSHNVMDNNGHQIKRNPFSYPKKDNLSPFSSSIDLSAEFIASVSLQSNRSNSIPVLPLEHVDDEHDVNQSSSNAATAATSSSSSNSTSTSSLDHMSHAPVYVKEAFGHDAHNSSNDMDKHEDIFHFEESPPLSASGIAATALSRSATQPLPINLNSFDMDESKHALTYSSSVSSASASQNQIAEEILPKVIYVSANNNEEMKKKSLKDPRNQDKMNSSRQKKQKDNDMDHAFYEIDQLVKKNSWKSNNVFDVTPTKLIQNVIPTGSKSKTKTSIGAAETMRRVQTIQDHTFSPYSDDSTFSSPPSSMKHSSTYGKRYNSNNDGFGSFAEALQRADTEVPSEFELPPASPLRATPSMMMIDAVAVSFEQNREETLQRFEDIQSTNPVYKILPPCIEEDDVALSSPPSSSPADKMKLAGPLAVFKETTNNEIERNGLMTSEVILRERAAYVLDKNSKGFSGVPPTALAKLSKEKRGSLQQYVESIGNCEENPFYLSKVDPEQVHKIGILDIRIFNTDRHGGNILITKQLDLKKKNEQLSRVSHHSLSDRSSYSEHSQLHEDAMSIRRESIDIDHHDMATFSSSSSSASTAEEDEKLVLVPIDHSLSLPSIYSLSDAFFDWAYYGAADIPFSQSTIDHILKNINIEQDKQSLAELGIRKECIATNIACTILLQTAVSIDPPVLLLSDFAKILQRPYPPGHELFDQYWSPFECMIDETFKELGESYKIQKEIAAKTPTIDHSPTPKFYKVLQTVIKKQLLSKEWVKNIPE